MKKFLAGIIGTGLTAVSLVGVSTESATAAPYPGTVATNCHARVISASASAGTRVSVWVTTAGEGRPRGSINVTVERRAGGDSASRTTWFRGGRTTVRLGHLRPGVYDGNMFFNSMPPKSVYKNCSRDFSFRVTR